LLKANGMPSRGGLLDNNHIRFIFKDILLVLSLAHSILFLFNVQFCIFM
jgi:hypothetical protein